METMNLQLFADAAPEAIQGTRLIYLYRPLKEAATSGATAVAFVTENEMSFSSNSDTTQTKDGPIVSAGTTEIEHTMTSILSKGDAILGKMKSALINKETIELWECNLDEPGETENVGKFKATYFQGKVTEWSETSNAEDMVEVSMTIAISGTGAEGWATVSDEQQEQASYVFKDTAKESE